MALYAEQVLHLAQPVIRRVDASTLTVATPGPRGGRQHFGHQPFTGRTGGIWGITDVTKTA